MKNATVFRILALALVTALAAACSGGSGSPAPRATAAPAATAAPTAISSTSKAASAPTTVAPATVAPAAKAGQPTQAPAPGAAQQPVKSSASDGSKSQAVTDVPVPANPAKYDSPRAVKIGEAVQLAKSGLVFQVTGVRTVNNDAKSEFVVADVVIGNVGKETQTISSIMLFGIVAGGWHSYGISLESIPQMVALKLPQPFDADIAAGKAGKGSLPILVPKDATGLTLVFQSMPGIMNEDPAVYVPLGIRGEGTLPLVAGDSPAVAGGKTYKVGESFKAPKRGLVVKVNGYWERTDGARNAKLGADEKFVLVDVTAAPLPGSKGLNKFNEIYLVTADGEEIRQTDKDGDVYLAESVQSDNGDGRGVALFRVSKSAAGLKLAFDPVDPVSPGFVFGSGDRLADEQAFIDLSGGALTAPTALTTLPTLARTATAKAPEAGDPNSVAPELKVVAVPQGFAVVKDSAASSESGGKVDYASATYFGKGDVKTVKEFFKKNLTEAAGFEFGDEDLSSSGPDEGDLYYSYTKGDASYSLSIYLATVAGGVEVQLVLEAM